MNITRKLTEGVGAWLHFEYCCGRSGLFDEKYLAAAVGQILSGTYQDRVIAEYPHPVLAPLQSLGRRPAVDFVVCENYPRVTIAVESKWAGSSHTTPETVLWDLIRLELVAHAHGATGVFLIAGQRVDLDKLFFSAAFSGPKGTPGVRPLLNFRTNSITSLSLMPERPYRVGLFRKLFSDVQKMRLPRSFLTQRSDPFPRSTRLKHYQVYAWTIKPALQREDFCPRISIIIVYAAHIREKNTLHASRHCSGQMKLIISGVPCCHKTIFGDWLRDEHGFAHVNLESRKTKRGLITPPAFDSGLPEWLALLASKVVITWGFPPNDHTLAIIQSFRECGFAPWWFSAPHEIAREHYAGRDGEMAARECFDPQMARVRKAEGQLTALYGVHSIETLNGAGYLPLRQIYDVIRDKSEKTG